MKHLTSPPGETFQGLALQVRGRTGLTQRELAGHLGMHSRSIQGWESGANYPNFESLQAFLAVSLEAGGFTVGHEASEAAALWAAAVRQAPRLRTPFDSAWFAGLVVRNVVRLERAGKAYELAESVVELNDSNAGRSRQDWGEAPEAARLHGRIVELERMKGWVAADRCRVVAVLGLGGAGKTMLTARLAEDLAPHFDRLYWRSLRDAPPATEWLSGAIGFISAHQAAVPEGEAARLALLLELLRQQRCLLILDNFDTLLLPRQRQGSYGQGYAAYGTLLQRLGESRGDSCLLLTSREAPPELGPLEGGQAAVRVLELGGLSVEEGQALLYDKGLVGDSAAWTALIESYAGNGLALKIAGESIRQVFDGNIDAFLRQGEPVFGGIRRMLDEQVDRLSNLEQSTLSWLAVERESIGFEDLVADLGPAVDRAAVLEAVAALRRRSLLIGHRAQTHGLTLHAVVLEYVTDRLVEDASREIASDYPFLLLRQALFKATARDFVRRSQERFIGAPVLARLVAAYGDDVAVERRFIELLDAFRARSPVEQGYGPGNIVNLLRLLRGDLRGADLSKLSIRQAYLRQVEAQDVSLAGAHLAETTLAEAFDVPASAALSANGAYLAAGTSSGEVRVWRVSDHTPILSVAAHASVVAGVALDGDGRLLASGSLDGSVKVWETVSGRLLATLHGHTGGVWAIAISEDGRLVASGGQDRTIRLWDAPSGRLLATLEGHLDTVWSVALSGDGRIVASGSQDGTIRLWETTVGQHLATLEGHVGTVWAVALSHDGHVVASGGQDETVRLWATSSGRLLTILRGHGGGVWGVALSDDGRLIASGGQDESVRLWEPNDGRLLATLQEHTGGVRGVALSNDGRLVVGASQNGAVALWDAIELRLLATLQGWSHGLWGVALSGDGRLVVGAGQDGTLRLWGVNDGRLLAILRGHSGGVRGVALSVDGQLLASGSQDGTVRLWETASGKLLASLEGHRGTVWAVALSGDGRLVASGSQDGSVRLSETASGDLRTTFEGHTGPVWGVALSGDGRVVASAGHDGTVRLWDTLSGHLRQTLLGHAGGVWAVALSADGRLVVGGNQDGSVSVWQTETGEVVASLGGHTGTVWAVAMSADGRYVASGGQDRTIRLWELPGSRPVATFAGHTDAVWGVALSSEGQLLASSSQDGSVRTWHTASATAWRTLRRDRPYERMDISGLSGITPAQTEALLSLGAIRSG
jgi:WD40 repeat protein/transcriptional regulator with XRE-family HTH domain